MDWRQLVDIWQEGSITDYEFSYEIFKVLGDGNTIQEFLDNAPPACVVMMIERLEKLPKTDDGWGKMRTCVVMMIERLEKLPKTDDGWGKMRIGLASIRKGVEAVRAKFEQ